ncbi:hypothetical protein G7066_08885 [Leucobacter coleopterorum]|uniref:Uncharacterized protein n=1 Tax=Leucobacter coleopterorum TaxID=2714933 RepID=A0ABX6K0E1_9MICO|nr:hypothetical protein [Leucobacter coleopterorum]QIM18697.1 hypothetical protein G7066_08885 [Leucobacter coleopterorum]
MSDSAPQHHAASVAYEALKDLAHTVREAPPAELYSLTGELLGITRVLPDVLRKVGVLVLARSEDATLDSISSGHSARTEIEAAARHLIAASEFIDAAQSRLDHAAQHLSELAWPPQPTHARQTAQRGLAATAQRSDLAAAQTVRLSDLAAPSERYTPPAQHGTGLTR